jgi:hypothetical protein
MSGAVSDAGGHVPPWRPHRPALFADLEELLGAAPEDEQTRRELAATTAALVVSAGRTAGAPTTPKLVTLADDVGLETLAELWRDAEPVSLPGVLWVMYLLRQWCHLQSDDVTRLWRAGATVAAADAVVAGLAEDGDADSLRRMIDDVLHGAYQGDFAVALERSAAMFRILATGRRETASGPEQDLQMKFAERNDRTASDLTTAAAFWRAGQLH